MSYRQQGYVPKTQQTARYAAQARGPRAAAAPARGAVPRRASASRPRRRKFHPIRRFFVLVLFALLATVGAMGVMMHDEVMRVEKAGTFYPGIYIDNYELHGATPQEAYDFLREKAYASLAEWKIDLTHDGRTWTINADTLGLNSALEEAVHQEVLTAYYIGRTGSFLERYQIISALKAEPYRVYTAIAERNMTQVDAMLEEIRVALHVEPVNAEISFDAGRNNPVVLQAEQPGRDVDVMALKAQVVGMIESMQAATIEVQTHSVAPSITAADLEGNLVRLGQFTTEIRSNSTPERNENIRIGCEKLNGLTFRADATLSFNDMVGKRTLENGYRQALEIVNGEYVMGVGGGICQVSSTFYQAALHAGFKVRDRTNHALLPLYIEKGADATVADRGIDLRMVNNTGAEIRIYARMYTERGKNYCQVSIYGQKNPKGYTYAVQHEQVEEILPPVEPKIVEDAERAYVTYTDQEKLIKGSSGYKVRSYQIVRDANGSEVDRIDLGLSTYNAVPAKLYIGTTPRTF